eukprot:IDg3727t1
MGFSRMRSRAKLSRSKACYCSTSGAAATPDQENVVQLPLWSDTVRLFLSITKQIQHKFVFCGTPAPTHRMATSPSHVQAQIQ